MSRHPVVKGDEVLSVDGRDGLSVDGRDGLVSRAVTAS
jgi:hypothetical protein